MCSGWVRWVIVASAVLSVLGPGCRPAEPSNRSEPDDSTEPDDRAEPRDGVEGRPAQPSTEPSTPASDDGVARTPGPGAAAGARCTTDTPEVCLVMVKALKAEQQGQEVARLLETACDGDLVRACYALGTMLYQGRGVSPDEARGRELLERSCRADYQAACDALGH